MIAKQALKSQAFCHRGKGRSPGRGCFAFFPGGDM